MQAKHIYIFDLDMTIVDTSVLLPMRKARNWQVVYRHILQSKLFEGMRVLVNKLKSNVDIGVVTSSPGEYARRVLEFHELDIPVWSAYHDTTYRKPLPHPYRHALNKVNSYTPQTHVTIIGDHSADLEAGLRLEHPQSHTTLIGVAWGESTKEELVSVSESVQFVETVQDLEVILI